jgi:hypothetical protein
MKSKLPPFSELAHRAHAALSPGLNAWRRRRRSLLAASLLAAAGLALPSLPAIAQQSD